MSDYSDAPDSPLHPDADQEVKDLPEQSLSESELDFLDLNPELETRGTTITPSPQQRHDYQSTNIYSNDHLYDRIEDFQPVLVPSPLNQTQPPNPIRLSSSQQSRFINYVDNKLLQIQRKFTQSFGLSEVGYSSIRPLLADLKALIDFVWHSIDPDNSRTTHEREYYLQQPNTIFGQPDYLIRIAGDFIEYISKMEVDQESAITLLRLLNSLDHKFARLIDGNIPGGEKLRVTARVRIDGIAQGSRLLVSALFEKCNIEGFHYELSKVYDQTLERTSGAI